MQLSHESYRARWVILVCTWLLAAGVFIFQAVLISDYLSLAGQLALRGAPQPNTAMTQVYPAFAADAQKWVEHAVTLHEGDAVRLRYTPMDNAPDGREVHWNSAWAWTIVAAGKLQQMWTGLPFRVAVEKSTFWLNSVVLLTLLVTLSAWTTRQAGAIAGFVVAFTMMCHDRILEGFFPTYVDHHGLLTVAVCGMMLGALFMGGGFWRATSDSSLSLLPKSTAWARQAAIFSGFSGACGLWVSAASTIPAVAITGIAGAAAILIQGRDALRQGDEFDGSIWRMWGRVGAGSSLFFYLLEYFPNHLSLRLEPNHPFYALAWLGGGELIAQLGERWLGEPAARWRGLHRLIAPVLAVSVAPLTVLIGRASVFVPLDPFLSRLHNDYIQEFLPMWKTLRGFNTGPLLQVILLGNAPLIAGVATLTYRRRESPLVLWFMTIAAGLLSMMAWAQSRWLLNASGAQLCLVLVLIGVWAGALRPRWRWLIAAVTIVVLFVPGSVTRYVGGLGDIHGRRVSPKDALGPLHRDVAAALRASQPQGEITVLSSPNGSVGVGYFGRFKTLGTLYWENNDGLKSAGAIYAAKSDREAAVLLRAHQVTHIALISDENFIAQYCQLLNPAATQEDLKQTFGSRLFMDKIVPQWLQMIPYKVPDDLKSLNVDVLLFKVNFKQNAAEWIYNVAMTQIARGELPAAERSLDLLIKGAPHNPQPWLRKGELLVTRQDWIPAAEAFVKGISLVPPAERPALYVSSANVFYNQKQHGIAAQIYRKALAERFSPELAAYLGWILATSSFDQVRNGPDALKLAEAALAADPSSPMFLNVQAAALAETGRMAEAVAIAEKSLVNARLRNDAAAIPIFQSRLQALKEGKVLRQ